jgi:hypothetical protein
VPNQPRYYGSLKKVVCKGFFSSITCGNIPRNDCLRHNEEVKGGVHPKHHVRRHVPWEGQRRSSSQASWEEACAMGRSKEEFIPSIMGGSMRHER